MPNKSVKGAARRSGWQSQFFSQVSGFAVGRRADGLSLCSRIFPFILRQAQDERKNPATSNISY